MNFYLKSVLIIIIFFALMFCGFYFIKVYDLMPIEIQDVTVEDIQPLIDRARVSGDKKLESILFSLKVSMMYGHTDELAVFVAKYNRHMLKEHYPDPDTNKVINLNTI